MSVTEFDSFTIRLPKTLSAKLRKIAERELSSLNREVNIAIRAHVDAAERKGRK